MQDLAAQVCGAVFPGRWNGNGGKADWLQGAPRHWEKRREDAFPEGKWNFIVLNYAWVVTLSPCASNTYVETFAKHGYSALCRQALVESQAPETSFMLNTFACF